MGDLWEASRADDQMELDGEDQDGSREGRTRAEQVTRGTRESQQSGRPLGSQQSR